MTSRQLRMFAAALAIGISAVVAPSSPSQAAPLSPEFSSVTVAGKVPADQPADASGGRATPVASLHPDRRRVRTRSRGDAGMATFAIFFAVVVGVAVFLFAMLIRYLQFKALKSQSFNTPNFNGPNGPQYGLTGGPNYGPQYPQAGTPMGTPPSQGYSNYGGTSNHTPGIG